MDTQALTGEDAPDNVVATLLEFSAGNPLRTLQPSEAHVSGTARMPVNSIQSRAFGEPGMRAPVLSSDCPSILVGQAVVTCSSRLYDDGATVRFDPRLPGIDKTFLAHFGTSQPVKK